MGEKELEYLLIFFENFTFFYTIFRKEYRSFSKSYIAGIFFCVLFLLFAIQQGWNIGVSITPFPAYLVVFYTILYCIFKVSIIEIIGLGLGQWLMISNMENALLVSMQNLKLNNVTLNCMIEIIIIIGLWMYYAMIGKRLDERLFQLPIKIWYLLDIIMLILTTMIAFFSFAIVKQLPDGRITSMGKILVVMGGCIVCILQFALIYYFNKTQNFRMQKELADELNEQQREYFLQLIQKEEETKQFRHDIIDDLMQMKHYYDKKEFDKLEHYLTDTLGVIENISQSNYDVGNDIVNTILNYYLQPIKNRYKIKVDGYMDEEVSIGQRDLCILHANLVKNAVEAVSKNEQGSIYYKVFMGEKYFSLKMVNSFEGELLLNKNRLPKTTKKDSRNHGIGLKNVMEIVKKYNGKYNVDVANGHYSVEIFLKL